MKVRTALAMIELAAVVFDGICARECSADSGAATVYRWCMI